MKLIKWNPTSPARTYWGNYADDFFNRKFWDTSLFQEGLNAPSVNIIEEDDSFLIELAVPGLSKDDFNIEVDGDQLTISAESENRIEEDKNGKYSRREFNYNAFKRSFYLPESIDQGSISAKYENGVLRLSLAKKEEARVQPPKTIKIG